jgi:hypothetical protein
MQFIFYQLCLTREAELFLARLTAVQHGLLVTNPDHLGSSTESGGRAGRSLGGGSTLSTTPSEAGRRSRSRSGNRRRGTRAGSSLSTSRGRRTRLRSRSRLCLEDSSRTGTNQRGSRRGRRTTTRARTTARTRRRRRILLHSLLENALSSRQFGCSTRRRSGRRRTTAGTTTRACLSTRRQSTSQRAFRTPCGFGFGFTKSTSRSHFLFCKKTFFEKNFFLFYLW